MVAHDGLDPATESSELVPWTKEYGWGLTTGLLEDASGQWRIHKPNLQGVVGVLAAVPGNTPWLASTVDRLIDANLAGQIALSHKDRNAIHSIADSQASSRPTEEAPYWQRLASQVDPQDS